MPNVINFNLPKRDLAHQAFALGLFKAGSMTKPNLMVFLHIHQCVQIDKFAGDFNWYRERVPNLKKIAIEKGGRNLSTKHLILSFLFECAERDTTAAESNMLKTRFLGEYQKLGGNNLRPPPPRPIRATPNNHIQYITDDSEPESETEMFRTPGNTRFSVLDVLSAFMNGAASPTTSRTVPTTSRTVSARATNLEGEDCPIAVEDDAVDDEPDIAQLTAQLSKLKLQVEILSKDLTCVVCYTNKRSVLFPACGHIATCITCAKQLNKTCPVCRTKTDNPSKVFF